MPKHYKIKWRPIDRAKIANLARLFNTKITNLSKVSPQLASFLPEKINSKELQKSIETRQDFNRIYKSYSRFLKPNSEQIVKTESGNILTKWELSEAKIKFAVKERKKKQKREELLKDEKSFTMGKVNDQNLMPSKLTPEKIKPGISWKLFSKSLDTQLMTNYLSKKSDNYKEFYIRSLTEKLGIYAAPLAEYLKNVSSDIIGKGLFADPTLHSDFIYYDPIDAENKVQILIEHWGDYLGIENFLDGVEDFEMDM